MMQMELTGKQRSALKSLAHKLDTIFQIGKHGITPELTEGIDNALEARELIKISVLENCAEEPAEAAEILGERTRSVVVQVIGRKIILFRQSKKMPKIKI